MSDGRDTQARKVARLIEEYGLQDVGRELERRWTRTENRSSLRDLTQYFNRSLLEVVLRETELDPLDGEITNFYQSLTDDDGVTSGRRQQALAKLREHDINTTNIKRDFVSYQSIRTYLYDCRNVAPPKKSASAEERRQTKKQTIQQLKSRLNTVASEALQGLVNAGNLSLGEFDIIVTVHVHCTDCGSRVSLTELLNRGRCDCPE